VARSIPERAMVLVQRDDFQAAVPGKRVGDIGVANSPVTGILPCSQDSKEIPIQSWEEICASTDEDSRTGSGSGSHGR
jgi:hypothetical protein